MTDERLAEIEHQSTFEYGESDAYELCDELLQALKAEREENQRLLERCKPNRILFINGVGHYVSEAVYNHIKAIRELPDKWRLGTNQFLDDFETGVRQGREGCSDELEAKLKENQHE